MENKILFEESQKFNQWWLILLLSIVTLVVIVAFVFMLSSKLETQIKDDGIYVRFYPRHKEYKHYTWHELKAVYVRDYSPITEYGGWGLKGFGDDKALNVSGKVGLQLVFNDGKKLLIGTQRSKEMTEILSRIHRYKEAK
jgi:hypothetical protein